MNRPSFAIMALGHPVIVGPAVLAPFALIWAAFQDSGWWPLAIVALLVASLLAKANTARMEYQKWQGAWDGMAGPARGEPAATGKPARWRPWLGSLLVAGIGLFLLANADDPIYRFGLAWLVLGLIAIGVVALIARRSQRKPSKAVPVTVCVTDPLLRVPSLKQAYRALPDHCLSLLRIARR